jgi:hypothetical protein
LPLVAASFSLGHIERQRGENPANNVINFEAAREKRLLRKSRGYIEPPKHIKIITAFLNRYQPELTPAIDEAPLSGADAQREKPAPTTIANAEQAPLEPQNDEIALASIRRKLRLAQKERFGDSRKWQEIAKTNGWGTNPDYPDDGFYVDRIVECAQRLGLNPLTLTSDERKELTTHGNFIIERAKKLGLNPLTLTPEERQDLRHMGRILTPEERKEHAEAEARYSVRPLTPEEMERWLLQYGGQRGNDGQHHTLGEVIERILEKIGKGIKAIIHPARENSNQTR